MSSLLFWYGGLGYVIPRLILGAMLVAHGWPKIHNLKHNAKNFTGMGFRPGWLWGSIAAIFEFAGGIGILLGLWIPYLCFFLAGEFVVIIIWKWLRKSPFIGGWEFDALIFALILMFFTLYGGFYLI